MLLVWIVLPKGPMLHLIDDDGVDNDLLNASSEYSNRLVMIKS